MTASLPIRVRRSQVSARMSFQFPSSVKRVVIARTSFSRAALEKAANHLVATLSMLMSSGGSTPRRSRVGRITLWPMIDVGTWIRSDQEKDTSKWTVERQGKRQGKLANSLHERRSQESYLCFECAKLCSPNLAIHAARFGVPDLYCSCPIA